MPQSVETLLDEIRIVPALAGLSDEALAPMLEVGEVREYEAGETLFDDGDVADTLYFLVAGSVRISTRMASGAALDLAVLERGAILGEVGLLARRTRSARGTAVGPVRAYCAEMDQLVRHYHEGREYSLHLFLGVSRLLADRLQAMNRRVSELIGGEKRGSEIEKFKRRILEDWAV